MSEHKDPHRTDGIKRTPLVAERLLLLQEVLEGTGRRRRAKSQPREAKTIPCNPGPTIGPGVGSAHNDT
jgi:hypothetical protein